MLKNKSFNLSKDINNTTLYAIKVGDEKLIERLLEPPRPAIDYEFSVRYALEQGKDKIIEKFLQDPRLNPGYNDNSMFIQACKYGRFYIVQLLLKDLRVTPKSFALSEASNDGHFEVVQLLLSDIRINVASIGCQAISRASQNGHLEVVRVLLADNRINPTENRLDCVFRASYKGHIDVLKLLLQDSRVQAEIFRNYQKQISKDPKNEINNRILQAACENGHIDIVAMLLSDNKFGLNWKSLYSACAFGHFSVLQLLLNDPRVKIDLQLHGSGFQTGGYNEALNVACQNGHVGVVIYLLENYATLNPFASVDSGISKASSSGHLDIVKILSKDKRCHSFHLNEALFSACMKGQYNVAEFLLKNTTATPTAKTLRKGLSETCQLPLEAACAFGHEEIVKLLLSDKRTDPASNCNYNIITACQKGHLEVVKILLQTPGVDPTVNGNMPLVMACSNGHLDVVRLLLVDKRIDIGNKDFPPFVAACRTGKYGVVEFLLQDNRFDPCANDIAGLRAAILGKHIKTYKLLLKDARVNPSQMKVVIPKLRKECQNGSCLMSIMAR